MEADKIDLVCKPGLYLHLAQQYGYKVIDYYPPSYEPIFSLACSILCMHKNGNIPEFC